MRPERWKLAGLCLATFMLLLDITIVQAALPAIQRRPARPLRAAVHHPRRDRAQPRQLAAPHLAAPDPVSTGHPARHHLSPAPARLRLTARRCRPPRPRDPAAAGPRPPGEIRGYRRPYPDPGDSQATRDAIDTALSACESTALAC